MKKGSLLLIGALVLIALIGVQKVRAQDTPQLEDLWFNQNGTFTEDLGTGVAGVNETGLNEGTGLGTITFTDTTTGAGYFNTFINEAVGTEFYDEYATTSGALASGESYEIGSVPGSESTGYTDTASTASYTAFSDAENGTLNNTNGLPEGTNNFLGTCTGSCNGDVALALGDSFTVASGDEEIITVTISQTAPTSGFYIAQTNPCEDNPCGEANSSTGTVYYSLSAEQMPVNTGGGGGTTGVPEPGTWVLLLSGLGGLLFLGWRQRHPSALRTQGKFAVLLVLAAVAFSASAKAQEVLTVPWDPSNPASPHTAYAGTNIVLGATFVGGVSGHTYTYSWNYGDGSAATTAAAITNPNDISSSHTYPSAGSTAGITSWTAVVTVTDTTSSLQYTGNYLVIWENNTLQSRVNVAIDWGLWYLHQSMYHPSSTTGNWDSCASGYNYSCGLGYGSVGATNVQAFEVNGHLANGPATDPYTSDVAEGIGDFWNYLAREAVASKGYTFNPATANFGCSDGTAPTTTNRGTTANPNYCDASATMVYYNPTATSCTTGTSTTPCNFTFDGNSNGYAVFATQEGYTWGYEDGMYADALVASGTPSATVTTGAMAGDTYQTVVQDIVDGAAYCQYGGDTYDVQIGYSRGSEPYQGGGWWYNCQEGDDNSVSQWASIGMIAANRGFGISIPTIVTDANNMWVTASQNVTSPDNQLNPADTTYTVDNPAYSTSSTYDYGGFGYNGSLYYSDAWGPWAVTPSGMVQMSLDGIGRTSNTSFGSASNAADQRFNNAETYYADNFCNPLTGAYDSAVYTPRNYTYGLFSFTKSMLLHNPGGVLTPIQYLRTQTPNVFTGDSSDPANTIDWYAALSSANGGTDACDGVAQTLVGRQNAAGYWFGDNYYSYQNYYETAWSLIMLQKSVFVACVNNLQGAGTKLRTAGRVDLSWTGIPSASGYEILRGTTNGGPYTEIGTTTNQSYSDTNGLVQGDTYYYVLQPTNAGGTALCQSNQATIPVP